jgi:uncharacterized membrane-anchored protein
MLIRLIATSFYLLDQPLAQQEQAVFTRNLGAALLDLIQPGIAKGGKVALFSRELGGYIYSALRSVIAAVIAYRLSHDRRTAEIEKASKIPFE